jgi:hypothetical protein
VLESHDRCSSRKGTALKGFSTPGSWCLHLTQTSFQGLPTYQIYAHPSSYLNLTYGTSDVEANFCESHLKCGMSGIKLDVVVLHLEYFEF